MKMKILNLTQHEATEEQKNAGVCEPYFENKENIRKLLTFNEIPTENEIWERAELLTKYALFYRYHYHSIEIMIGGAPFLMSALEKELKKYNLMPVYAFSKRETKEEKNENGEVVKKNIFKHLGFVKTIKE